MPGLDKTGPTGQGALTGRRTGSCNTNAESRTRGFFNRKGIPGQSMPENPISTIDIGRGVRRGFGRFFGKNRGRI